MTRKSNVKYMANLCQVAILLSIFSSCIFHHRYPSNRIHFEYKLENYKIIGINLDSLMKSNFKRDKYYIYNIYLTEFQYKEPKSHYLGIWQLYTPFEHVLELPVAPNQVVYGQQINGLIEQIPPSEFTLKPGYKYTFAINIVGINQDKSEKVTIHLLSTIEVDKEFTIKP